VWCARDKLLHFSLPQVSTHSLDHTLTRSPHHIRYLKASLRITNPDDIHTHTAAVSEGVSDAVSEGVSEGVRNTVSEGAFFFTNAVWDALEESEEDDTTTLLDDEHSSEGVTTTLLDDEHSCKSI
jgi:hypothetical protein